MNVDWRNRFGRNWVTSVRNQGGSQNCWAFATTALYESMIRIEHCLWTRRSEGEVVHGAGKQAWDLGNIGEGSIFIERYGLADPDCFPWGETAALYTAREGGAALSATPLSPTPDRSGRTMRISAGMTTTLSDAGQKKQWIDLTGPMAVFITPPGDFGALGDGIYVPTGTSTGTAHALLVIGFNDDERCWIVKNSWGTGWGASGFGRLSYDGRTSNGTVITGGGLLETATFWGVRGTNPDPWSRRRLRNGVMIQGGNGAGRNNFELFIRVGMTLEHWYRENSAAGTPWNRIGVVRSTDGWRDTFHDDALDCPAAVQSTFNRNYELVYRTTFNQLRHVYYDQGGGLWQDGTTFGPINAVGMPAFIQSNRGAPGDFEVVTAVQNTQAEHWTKHNSAPWTRTPGQWYQNARFGANIWFGGTSLVHSNLGVPGAPENGAGELHYVCTLLDGQMQHWYRPVGGNWTALGTFGQNVASGPCMIQGTYGAGDEMGHGNFELCVAVGNQIEHWWRYNTTPGAWTKSAVFGSGVRRVLSLIQSSFGTNLEVIAELTDNRYQHFWRDGSGWNAGPIITSAGIDATRLTVSASTYAIPNQPTTLTITSRDAVTGALVTGRVYINGVSVSLTNQPFTYTFNGTERVTVRATSYGEAVVSMQWTPQLTVTASPLSVLIGRRTSMTITSKDKASGASVAGRVWIGDVDTAPTNQSFSFTFDGGETVIVRAAGYPDAPVSIAYRESPY